MNDINSLIIEGVIQKKSPLTQNAAGFNSLTLELGVSRTYKSITGEEVTETDDFPVACYGNVAQFVDSKAEIGRKIRAVGRLKRNKWTDKDGKKQKGFVVYAEHIEIMPKKKEAQ